MSAGLIRVGGGRVDWTVGSGPLGPPVLRIPTPRVACTDASRRESDTARHESRSPGARNGIADGAAGGAHGVGVAASMRAHAAWRGWLRCHRLRTSAKAGVARAGIASMHAVVGLPTTMPMPSLRCMPWWVPTIVLRHETALTRSQRRCQPRRLVSSDLVSRVRQTDEGNGPGRWSQPGRAHRERRPLGAAVE